MDTKDKEADKLLNSLKDDATKGKPEDTSEETDKYLAIEQPGISYTKDTNPTSNSDNLDYIGNEENEEWSEEGGNSRNSDAFNQDDDLLEDNLDLDEDQNQSISSDDDFEESNERYTN
nr:hypothetical protein [uncultured Flavobacterium sp.]